MTVPALLPFGLPPPESGPVDLLIVAGEHSGDEHAARLVRELLGQQPGRRVCALGGPAVAAAGAQLLHDLTASSVVGFVEVLKHYRYFKALFDATVTWVERHRPRAICFVDYPGFNLRLAARLRERGLTVKGGGATKALYYISPQIWAWKAQRRFTMARDLDAMAVIFPFEPSCYADTSLPVEFVGHPFLAADYVPPVAYDPDGPILLLPGSRTQAVARILPSLLGGFTEFSVENADRGAVVLYPSDSIAATVRGVLGHWPKISHRISLKLNEGRALASAVLTSSGTMSLHCALAGIPGAIAYRTNPLTYLLARWWVKLDYIGIANLLLREPMYPEFIQGAATGPALGEQLRQCHRDPERRKRTARQAADLRRLLQQPAGGTAAAWVGRHLAS